MKRNSKLLLYDRGRGGWGEIHEGERGGVIL